MDPTNELSKTTTSGAVMRIWDGFSSPPLRADPVTGTCRRTPAPAFLVGKPCVENAFGVVTNHAGGHRHGCGGRVHATGTGRYRLGSRPRPQARVAPRAAPRLLGDPRGHH